MLETARGGIVLRGVGYESNEASILTNVSADHLDLQGIHTLPELAEVKATICRITRPDGWTVLNGDDPLVAAVARRTRARVALFSLDEAGSAAVRRHLARGGRAYLVRRGVLVEVDGARSTSIVPVAEVPITIGGIARHNVANALAAAGGARALGATIEQVADGLRDFRPTSERSPGRLNLYRLGQRIVIVDFAHNEAGIAAVLDVAEGIAGGAAGRTAPITIIIGTAGDRPDDTLRGIGRIAAQRAQRVAIKETLGLPPRADPRVDRRRAAGGRGGRRPIGRRGHRLRVRDRRAAGRAERRRFAGRGARCPTRRGPGRRPDVPRGARGRLRPARPARRPADRRRHRADRAAAAPPGAAAGGPASGDDVTSRTLTFGGTSYPLVLPSIRDPRLHVAAVIITIHVLGQVGLHFQVSVPQILAAILTCAVIEVVLTFRQSRSFVWPASAMLTGSGVALILRVGTPPDDPWSTYAWYVFAAVAGLSLLTKYVIRYRGSHVFNPSNIGLVVAFVVLGSSRVEPLDFWWAPLNVWMIAAYAVIIAGGLLITRRLHLLALAATFWVGLGGRRRDPRRLGALHDRELGVRARLRLRLLAGDRHVARRC